MRRFAVAVTLFAAFVLASAPFAGAAGQKNGQTSGSSSAGANVDKSSALVQLVGDPLSTYSKTRPAPGKKVNFDSSTVKAYSALLNATRNDFKQWLHQNAPAAKVTGSWELAINAVSVQLNGTPLSVVASAPQAVYAQYEGLYHPDPFGDPDLALINAMGAWTLGGGGSSAGTGVKVAIIDSGIDASHPCFDDTGYAPQTQLGDTSLTNNKVIVAKVFNNKTPGRGYTAEAIQEHGTHVAGTVACDYLTPASVGGVTIPYAISGVAPHALLGNYNVFPGDVLNAPSESILNALEAAYEDGMDIANMSLGGGASGIKDLLSMAVDDLDQAGMVIAVAAGNSGDGNSVPPHLLAPGHYTIESPGSAQRALTAGAFTVGHFIGVNVSDNDNPANYAASVGDFGPYVSDVTGPLSADLGTYCTGGTDLTGEIALIYRGSCSFSTKIRNAQNDGAVGAIIVNNQYGLPIYMASDGTANQPTIPGVMVSRSDRTALDGSTGDSFTISHTQTYVYDSALSNYMASFSSEGPTDVDYRVKPDLSAPGVNVLSSLPAGFCDDTVDTMGCFAFFQGTSMATPHLAGTAAVVEWLHPSWSSDEVRSAIVNTADENVLLSPLTGNLVNDVMVTGNGRDNVYSAALAFAALDPVSISFGAVPAGSGQSLSYDVHITNLQAGDGYQFTLAIDSGGGGVHYSLSTTHIVLDQGETGTFTVYMTADKGADLGDHAVDLDVSGTSAGYLHAVVYTFIKQ